MPPASRNRRTPPDSPASAAACTLERPDAIATQNRLQSSRLARFDTLIATSSNWVLRRPVESAQYSRDADDRIEKPRRTGSPAFAGDDDRSNARPRRR